MVTVALPTAAVLLAERVSTLDAVAGLVANDEVTPVGSPVAVRLTLPAKGLTSAMLIVALPLDPCAIESALADDDSVKLPGPPPDPPQVTPFSANDVGTALVTLFQLPLNPTPVRLPPAGMLPL